MSGRYSGRNLDRMKQQFLTILIFGVLAYLLWDYPTADSSADLFNSLRRLVQQPTLGRDKVYAVAQRGDINSRNGVLK